MDRTLVSRTLRLYEKAKVFFISGERTCRIGTTVRPTWLNSFFWLPRCTHAALRGRDPYLYGIDDSQYPLRRDKEVAEEVGKEA